MRFYPNAQGTRVKSCTEDRRGFIAHVWKDKYTVRWDSGGISLVDPTELILLPYDPNVKWTVRTMDGKKVEITPRNILLLKRKPHPHDHLVLGDYRHCTRYMIAEVEWETLTLWVE